MLLFSVCGYSTAREHENRRCLRDQQRNEENAPQFGLQHGPVTSLLTIGLLTRQGVEIESE